MTESADVGGGGSFAEHLDDRIARDEMNEKEDDRDDDPKDRKREEDAAHRSPVVASRGLAGRFDKNTGFLDSLRSLGMTLFFLAAAVPASLRVASLLSSS